MQDAKHILTIVFYISYTVSCFTCFDILHSNNISPQHIVIMNKVSSKTIKVSRPYFLCQGRALVKTQELHSSLKIVNSATGYLAGEGSAQCNQAETKTSSEIVKFMVPWSFLYQYFSLLLGTSRQQENISMIKRGFFQIFTIHDNRRGIEYCCCFWAKLFATQFIREMYFDMS